MPANPRSTADAAQSPSLERWRVEVSFDPSRLLSLEKVLTPDEQAQVSDKEIHDALESLVEEKPSVFFSQPFSYLPARVRSLTSPSYYEHAWKSLMRESSLKEVFSSMPPEKEMPHLPVAAMARSWSELSVQNQSTAFELWQVLPDAVRDAVPSKILDKLWIDASKTGSPFTAPDSRATPELSGRISTPALLEGWKSFAQVRPDGVLYSWKQIPERLRDAITDAELRGVWERAAEYSVIVALSWLKEAPFSVSSEEVEKLIRRWARQYPQGVMARARGDSSFRDLPEIPKGMLGYAWQQLVKRENGDALRELKDLEPEVREEITPEMLRSAWIWYGRERPEAALHMYNSWPAEARRALSPEDLAEMWGVLAGSHLSDALQRLPKLPKAARALVDLTRLRPEWERAVEQNPGYVDGVFKMMPSHVLEAMSTESIVSAWRKLVASLPVAAIQNFPKLTSDALACLGPADLALLMSNQSSEVRTQAITLLGKVGSQEVEMKREEKGSPPSRKVGGR